MRLDRLEKITCMAQRLQLLQSFLDASGLAMPVMKSEDHDRIAAELSVTFMAFEMEGVGIWDGNTLYRRQSYLRLCG